MGFVTVVVSHNTVIEIVKFSKTMMLKMKQIKYFLDNKKAKKGWFFLFVCKTAEACTK